MSSSPPPGWYRDPSYPLTERWWDGAAWTDHRRQPEAPPQQPPPQPSSKGSGRAKAVALTAAGVVLVASIVTGAVVLGRGHDGGGDAEAKTTADASASSTPSPSPSPTTPEPSADDPSVVVDELNGVTYPLVDGWVTAKNVAEDDVVMTTPGTYDCPGDPGLCRHGRVVSRTAGANGEKSPKALALGDISDAADAEYDRDGIGNRPFGGIESHQLVKSGQVAVAGRAGYFVRWRVRTAKGPGGYVQSLVFPSSVGSESLVLVRFAFDAGPDGPPLADLDRITKGIRPVDDASTGGGVGSSIGPTQ